MKILKKVKEIRSKKGELHFKRFAIIETKLFSVYIHFIYKSDEDDIHNHPWDFISIPLKGFYYELLEDGKVLKNKFSIRKAKEYHKILSIPREQELPIITLFFTGKKYNDWGYKLKDGSEITNSEYRKLKN